MYKKLTREEEKIIRESVSPEPAKKGSVAKSLIWFVLVFFVLAMIAYLVFSTSLA